MLDLKGFSIFVYRGKLSCDQATVTTRNERQLMRLRGKSRVDMSSSAEHKPHCWPNRGIILVSERFGHLGGGEAIKAQQYANYLLGLGFDLLVITAERSKTELGADIPNANIALIPDTTVQKLLWRFRPLRKLLGFYFQIYARKEINRHIGRFQNPVLHYISPVSPVELRFPPKGYHTVFGPLTGNIYYPPGFRSRMSVSDKLREYLHSAMQIFFGRLLGNKRNVDIFLVSGYERTRASLRMAGCSEDQMINVVDSGVSTKLASLPRVLHNGFNGRFMCAARFTDYKGIDLAIRSTALASPHVTLDIYGDGELRSELEALVERLDLKNRVRFMGWVHNDILIDNFKNYRGFIFPSLAEANGIIMQEAMMAGLPVVAFRWGGPEMLGDSDSTIFIEPRSLDEAVSDIAIAMNRLSQDSEYADCLSIKGREIAEKNFTWNSVVSSWLRSYNYM